MRDLDVFLPKIKPSAVGVSDPAAFDAVRDSIAEFCRRTRLWRFDETFDVSAAESQAISAPYGAMLFDIERVNFNGAKLDPASTQWLDAHINDWRTMAPAGAPKFFTQTQPGTITLVPAAAGTVQVWSTLELSQDADQAPDFIADQHRETIAHGALARLLMLPGKPYSNPNLAQQKQMLYERDIDGLKVKVIRGQQRAPLRTRAQYM
ncbi:hypothetical protein [Caballeronia zhejiangensis]|uniref:Uncharacterized protein n=1 Tax=Caballeronia zhejiangensis TaxID=871203 RepID=A0A656QEG9_9BURK|nr:hypothetical protein [Caballeronia zhejiangensis]KDR25961.1 hypothetical protein BG60_26470 [Caballeronia zhejiangensis]